MRFMLQNPIVKWMFIALLRVYKYSFSLLLGPRCCFYPSCSDYTRICIQRFGVLKGCYLGAKRVIRCHPFSQGGIDDPPS